jgi:hypothetical protein
MSRQRFEPGTSKIRTKNLAHTVNMEIIRSEPRITRYQCRRLLIFQVQLKWLFVVPHSSFSSSIPPRSAGMALLSISRSKLLPFLSS